MKKYFSYLLLTGMITLSLTACVGKADSDGHKSMEGAADPVNDGGKLSGDNDHDSTVTHADSMKMK